MHEGETRKNACMQSIVVALPPSYAHIGSLSNDEDDGNENGKKKQ